MGDIDRTVYFDGSILEEKTSYDESSQADRLMKTFCDRMMRVDFHLMKDPKTKVRTRPSYLTFIKDGNDGLLSDFSRSFADREIAKIPLKNPQRMDSIRRSLVLLAFLGILSAYAQSPPSIAPAAAPAFSISVARSLDVLLQDYAYRAFVRPRTAVLYNASVPPNITGITLSVIRFRSGSLRLRGVASLKEFVIPDGVIATPWVERLALVYQNLGNWSSFYYGLPGYTFLSPVLGLLAYDARNLSATNLSELSFVASRNPILIHFQNVKSPIDGSTPRCVWFNLEGLPEFKDLESGETSSCSMTQQGHFSIVVNSTAPLAPGPE
ncbi:hypothetical protein QJS10_CPA07g01351 [Acorus calamus]|uniref:Uncharacterized protein n=1 Tax=Acorus calamus TaxID=4465 RepID=A0AAV9ECY4_ACOCL|nr:hypothetical protein QJS10_CPA07g01351 [Acorus calamus]